MSKKSSQALQPAKLESFLLIREAAVPKLGQRAGGTITYQVLTDAQRQTLYLRISANTSGGYFSHEAVPVTAIRRCLDGVGEGKTLRAVLLRPAFVGKSINNSGFLGAALLAEGLLARNADSAHELVKAGSWSDWEQACRAIEGDLPMVQLGKGSDGAAPEPASEAAPEAASDPAPDAAPDSASEPGSTNEPEAPAAKPKSKPSRTKASKQVSDAPDPE